MRYSIISRFRGSLLGAIIAEKIIQPSQIKPNSIANVLIPGAQSLVALGKFERESWLEKFLVLKLTPSQAIIATLPLALFYHDNKIKLRLYLLSAASIWQHEPIIQQSILALGYAIAHTLTEQSPNKLIPETVAFLDSSNIDLTDKLQQVQTLLEQKAGIDKTLIQLTQSKSCLTASIALGFYYFLSIPEDFNLSVKRSRRSPESSAIVGALSGAYNSAASIPSSLLVDSQTSAQAEMLQLSDSLVAVWSGVYDSKAKLISTAVAAPRVIRSR